MLQALGLSFEMFMILVGLGGQAIFFMRWVVQYMATHKHKKPTIPLSFFVLSIVGSFFVLFYAWYRQDIVFLIQQTALLFFYFGNLLYYFRKPKIPDGMKSVS
jgi:lipid-A-disaccharide synthase-like uncharacterized protein